MCSTPWSARAWITISAPVISVMGLLHPYRVVLSGRFSGNQKGARKPLYAHRHNSQAALAAPGDALPKYDNKIAHEPALPPESCATSTDAAPRRQAKRAGKRVVAAFRVVRQGPKWPLRLRTQCPP